MSAVFYIFVQHSSSSATQEVGNSLSFLKREEIFTLESSASMEGPAALKDFFCLSPAPGVARAAKFAAKRVL
jgi:hypothetical protein